jgi:hypothetical protein
MTDAAFRAWIQTLPSCISGKFSEWLPDLGEWRNPACHVRRAGRSGVAFKEAFACIPLTNDEHQYQHQHGELACLLRYLPKGKMVDAFFHLDEEDWLEAARDWFTLKAAAYAELWRKTKGKQS